MILPVLTGVFSSEQQGFVMELSMIVLHLKVPLNCQTLMTCANVWNVAFIIYIHFHTALLTSLTCCFQCAQLVYARKTVHLLPQLLVLQNFMPVYSYQGQTKVCCTAAGRSSGNIDSFTEPQSQSRWAGKASLEITYSRCLRLCPVGF